MSDKQGAEILSLNKNGLNVIFSKLEVELGLKKALRMLWDADQEHNSSDCVLSHVRRTHTQDYAFDRELPTVTELKINVVTHAHYEFMGMAKMPDFIEDKDIVAQVRVVKNGNYSEVKKISDAVPWPALHRLGLAYNFDVTCGMFHLLILYSQKLYKEDFRVSLLELDKDCFHLHMINGDVLVKIMIYIADHLNARLLLAHTNTALLDIPQ